MNCYKFKDYRDFIRALLKRGKATPSRGELRRLAEYMNVNSSYLSQVLNGSKSLSLEQAMQTCEYFGVSSAELEFFLLLVNFDRAGSKKLKDFFQKKVLHEQEKSRQVASRMKEDTVLTEKQRAKFYSSILYSAVRLQCSIGKGKTVDQIAEIFRLSKAKAQEVLDFLTDCGLCNSNNGIYVMGPQSTHLGNDSELVARMHTNWRLVAIRQSENVTPEELMFTAPFSIDKESFEWLREAMLALIAQCSDKIRACEPEKIGLLNVDLLWLKP